MTTYHGICCGGPYNGARWSHYDRSYKVAIPKRGVSFCNPASPHPPEPEISVDYGEYRFDGNVWVWHGPWFPKLKPGDRVEHATAGGFGIVVDAQTDRVIVRWDDGKIGTLFTDEKMVPKTRHLIKLRPDANPPRK